VEIREGVDGELKVAAPYKDLVLCNTLHPFWIGWKHDHLAVGQGTVPWENIIADYKKFPLESINTVSLATFTGNRGTWRFRYTSPDEAYVEATTTTPMPTTPAPPPTTQEPETPPPETQPPETTVPETTMAPTPEMTTPKAPVKLAVEFAIDADYDLIIGEGEENKTAFMESLSQQLARQMGISVDYVKNMDVKPGSIIVSFVLEEEVDDEVDIEAAYATLEKKITDDDEPMVVIVPGPDGEDITLEIDEDSLKMKKVGDEEPTGGMSAGEQAGIAIAVLVGCALLGVAGYFGYNFWQQKQMRDNRPVHFTNPGYKEDNNTESATFDAKVIFGQEAQENGGY